MKLNTKRRKKSIKGFENIYGRKHLIDQMYQIFCKGKEGLDAFLLDLGKMLAESIMYIEREEISGPDYCPLRSDIQKWASQRGSIYLEDQKVVVDVMVQGENDK
tara:strand:+ start:200 stop:511 length:312 start_codon:yes stop_codon:yes gene_type:complete